MRRRTTILLLILALFAGPAVGAMPTAMAVPAMAMTGDDDGCKGCDPARMSVADCGALCVSFAAIVQPAATVLIRVVVPPWRRDRQSIQSYATEPPTAPPRS